MLDLGTCKADHAPQNPRGALLRGLRSRPEIVQLVSPFEPDPVCPGVGSGVPAVARLGSDPLAFFVEKPDLG